MRKGERLSQIIEIVQDGRLHLARDLAERLQVSQRTIYRDIETLVASGIPIEGERGLGYLLREPVFLPPLNLSLLELEALHLGMAIVGQAADAQLQAASASLTKKIEKVATANGTVPDSWGFGVYPFVQAKIGFQHMPRIRASIRSKEKMTLRYRSLQGEISTRRVWPLESTYWGRVWTLTCWCEKRADFRVFRIDNIESCARTHDYFPDQEGRRMQDYLTKVDADLATKER